MAGRNAPPTLPTTTAEWQVALRRMGLLGARGVPMDLPTTTAEWQVFVRAIENT